MLCCHYRRVLHVEIGFKPAQAIAAETQKPFQNVYGSMHPERKPVGTPVRGLAQNSHYSLRICFEYPL